MSKCVSGSCKAKIVSLLGSKVGTSVTSDDYDAKGINLCTKGGGEGG